MKVSAFPRSRPGVRCRSANSVLGRLPKGTMVTGQGTRIVWLYRNRSAHTA